MVVQTATRTDIQIQYAISAYAPVSLQARKSYMADFY